MAKSCSSDCFLTGLTGLFLPEAPKSPHIDDVARNSNALTKEIECWVTPNIYKGLHWVYVLKLNTKLKANVIHTQNGWEF